MAVNDVKAQSVLYSWMIPFIIAILAYILLKKYGNTFKDRYIYKKLFFRSDDGLTVIIYLEECFQDSGPRLYG